MKSEVFLQLVDRLEVPLLACRSELLEGGVRAGDVGGVMLAMMQLKQPRGVMRLQRRVVVWQFRQFILLHGNSLLWMGCVDEIRLGIGARSSQSIRGRCWR